MVKKINEYEWHETVDLEDIPFTHTEIMAKFIGSIDPDGYPHLSFITSNKVISPDQVKWGAFTQGMSKKNVLDRPKQGMLYMTAEMPFQFLQLKAHFDYVSEEGEDATDFNQMDLFRYNTYMRIYKVYFNNIIAARRIRDISLFGIAKGILSNLNPLKPKIKTGVIEPRLERVGDRLFSGMIFPKFISYLDTDGYPVIIPCFQARSVELKRIFIPLTQFKPDLLEIAVGAKVSLFAMDFETVSQMVKGRVIEKLKSGILVDIDQIYNSMPPKIGQLYPTKDLNPKIEEFPKIL